MEVAIRSTGHREVAAMLTRYQRRVMPSATAQALNRTATKVKQLSVADAVTSSAKAGRNHSRAHFNRRYFVQRAHSKKLTARVGRKWRSTTQDKVKGEVSGKFIGPNGHTFVRALTAPPGYRGKGWTTGRPRTSPRNLPIWRVGISARSDADRRRNVREDIRRNTIEMMRSFYPGELRRQVNNKLARLK